MLSSLVLCFMAFSFSGVFAQGQEGTCSSEALDPNNSSVYYQAGYVQAYAQWEWRINGGQIQIRAKNSGENEINYLNPTVTPSGNPIAMGADDDYIERTIKLYFKVGASWVLQDENDDLEENPAYPSIYQGKIDNDSPLYTDWVDYDAKDVKVVAYSIIHDCPEPTTYYEALGWEAKEGFEDTKTHTVYTDADDPDIPWPPITSITITGDDEIICVSETGYWTATVAGGTDDNEYQWQISENGYYDNPKTWYDISGATSTTYSCNYDVDFLLRVQANNGHGSNYTSGIFEVTVIPDGKGKTGNHELVPVKFGLAQNYPNPFNPATSINYQLPVAANVSIVVFDVAGREVARLVERYESVGFYSVNFDASNLASGTYFYRITAGNFTQTKKMLLVK